MGIKQKAVSGVKWNTIATVYCMVLQIVRLAILTRLLERSDFGLIAIAIMIIAFTEIFSDLGITVGVLHKQDITDNQYSSVYWLNVITSVAIFLILWACSPLISEFYKEPILNKIVPLLGLQVLMNGFGKMFQTTQTKEMEFRFLSLVRILVATLSLILTVIFALAGFGVYSLVWGQLFQVALNQVFMILRGRKSVKVKFHFNPKEIYDIIKIGSYKLGSDLLDFISSRVDIFLIGYFFSMDDLGIYNISKDLIIKPYTIARTLTGSVATAAFAKIQNNFEYLKECFCFVLKIVAFVAIPTYILMFVFSDLIVSILYAPEFSDASIFIKIMAFVGIETCLSGQAGILQVALGRTDIGYRWTLIRVIESVVVILIAGQFSIVAVAYGQLILSIVNILLYWWLVVYAMTSIGLRKYLETFTPVTLFLVAVSIIPVFLLSSFTVSVPLQVLLLIIIVAAFIFYFFMYQRSFFDSVLYLALPSQMLAKWKIKSLF